MTLPTALNAIREASPEATVAMVREELEDLQRAGLLGPFELRWAIDELVGGAVALPEVLGVVFDFGETEWFDQIGVTLAQDSSSNALLEELARHLGLDVPSGTRVQEKVSASPRSTVPPTTGAHKRDASAPGSEGVRQRPLRGWG